MIYTVSHRTRYVYSIPVSFSHHRLHLTPRACDHQVCHRTMLSVTPVPAVQTASTDYFGNPVVNITLQDQHEQLTLHAQSVIQVTGRPLPLPADTAAWDGLYPALFDDRSDAGLAALQFAFASPHVRVDADLAAYAATSFPRGRPVLEGALDLTRRIHADFDYDPTATTVTTSVDQVFERRRGVCQDFAHLEIGCLRALRVPARYVSGYLLTYPPEGQEKLVGADASHAWLSVFCGDDGWIDLDPTNNKAVGDEHVTIAWGRDYGDVSPVNGAIFGGGTHRIEVAVDVTPTAAPADW